MISTAGSWLLGGGLLIVLTYLALALKSGAKSTQNPWESASYEWFSPSPPPPHNYDELPRFERDPYDYGPEAHAEPAAPGPPVEVESG